VYFASVRLALAVPDRDGHARRDHDRPQVAAYDVGVIPDFAQVSSAALVSRPSALNLSTICL
jgi:hypothetical protein